MIDLLILCLFGLFKGIFLTGTIIQTKEPYYISKEIKLNLEKSKEIIRQANQDRVFLITGREGSGKSKLARQLAYFIDNRFNLDDICFDSKTFRNKIRTTQKKVVIFDEAFKGLSSRGALSKENRTLVQTLIECRQRNLTLFIVLPSIFLLEKYIAIFRSHGLFHTKISKKNYKNRYYKVYNYENKKLLYMLGQKYMSYSRPKITRKHRFYENEPPTINIEEYDKKKLEAFMREEENENAPSIDSMARMQRNYLFLKLKRDYGMSYVEIADYLTKCKCPINDTTISLAVRNLLKKRKNDVDI